MKTCLKCDHTRVASDPPPLTECPKCGAIYAKLEALAAAGVSVESRARVAPNATIGGRLIGYAVKSILVVGVSSLAVVAFRAYDAKAEANRRHAAALERCGAVALTKWHGEFDESVREFQRVSDAAGKSARIALAPMLLRMSDTIAVAERKTPPPCAADGARTMIDGMKATYEAFGDFALQRNEVVVAESFQRARGKLDAGIALLLKADGEAIH